MGTRRLKIGRDWLHWSCWKALPPGETPRFAAEAARRAVETAQQRAQTAARRRAEALDAVVRSRLEVLESGKRLGNVAEACRRAGVTRDTYYRWKQQYEQLGEAGLRPKPPRARLAPEVEDEVMRLTAKHPGWGKWRIARYMKGVISPNGVWAVWCRRGRSAGRRTE